MAIANSLEKFFCKAIETSFNAATLAVDIEVVKPLAELVKVKAFAKKAEKLDFKIIEAKVFILQVEIIELLKIANTKKNKSSSDFCKSLFACEPAKDLSVSFGLISPFDVNDFTKFEKKVCKLGIGNFISNFLSDRKASIESQLAVLQVEIATIDSQLDGFILDLENSTANLIAKLDDLTPFETCGFVDCDFSESSTNKKNDSLEKVSILSSGKFDDTNTLATYDKKRKDLTNDILGLIFLAADIGKPPSNKVPRDEVAG